MDFRLAPEQQRLRREVRDFLEAEGRAGRLEVHMDSREGWSPSFSKRLAERGWVGMTFPTRYGGGEKSHLERLVVTEELMRYGAPVAYHWVPDRQIGSCILAYGSQEQKQHFIPRICRAEVTFALGMSEPNAGSDLASLQTAARRKGDCFIITGQKIYTTNAHRADYIYIVARTDPTAPKHKGISEFIVDLKLPSVTIRPVLDITGGHHFNEVFLEEVQVPASALVGELNRGWYQIAVQLDHERSGIERLMSSYPLFTYLLQVAKEKPAGPTIRHKIANLCMEYEVGRLLVYRVAWVLDQGRIPTYEAAMAKDFCGLAQQHLAQLLMEVLGLSGQMMAGSKVAPLDGLPGLAYLWCRMHTMAGGTSEVCRNIIAQRGLGLPRA